jgi:hypothetical protein
VVQEPGTQGVDIGRSPTVLQSHAHDPARLRVEIIGEIEIEAWPIRVVYHGLLLKE